MKKVSKEDPRHSDKEINGCLYIIATPIGNYDDISLRAIKLLETVEILLCEDTRKTKRLLSYLNIKRKNLISYNDNNASDKRPEIINKLLSKKNIGLVSDAGTLKRIDAQYVGGGSLVKITSGNWSASTDTLSLSNIFTTTYKLPRFS